MDAINVFVTYAFTSEEHNSRVVALVNLLRNNGINANLDKGLSQRESAIDFNLMMVDNLRKSEKIIVVLNDMYKSKAEKGEGGVGFEYALILEDFKNNPKKYILVSFESLTDKVRKKILPSGFGNREIVDLYNDQDNQFNQLFAKILGKGTVELVKVASQPPEIKVEPIKFLDLKSPTSESKEAAQKADATHGPTISIDADFAEYLKHFELIAQRAISNSYYSKYRVDIVCEEIEVKNVKLVKKRVTTAFTLVNPLTESYAESSIINPVQFRQIPGVDDTDLVKIMNVVVSVDDSGMIDITDDVIPVCELTNALVDYPLEISFKRKKDPKEVKSLSFKFRDKLELLLKEERIVPVEDVVFIKRITKFTKNFALSYTFPHRDKVTTQADMIANKVDFIPNDIQISKSDNSVSVICKRWLAPGNGMFIVNILS